MQQFVGVTDATQKYIYVKQILRSPGLISKLV